jgi:hypothetical protein
MLRLWIVVALFAWSMPVQADDIMSTETDEAEAKQVARQGHERRGAELQVELAEVNAEHDEASTLGPWLVIGVGTASVLTGATIAAIDGLTCDEPCDVSATPGAAVMLGAAVATVGLLWLRWTEADIEEIETRRHAIERDLQYRQLETDGAQREPNGPSASFNLRFRF